MPRNARMEEEARWETRNMTSTLGCPPPPPTHGRPVPSPPLVAADAAKHDQKHPKGRIVKGWDWGCDVRAVS